MLSVEQWAEIRRLKHVVGLSQREIHRHTGIHRDTVRKAVASEKPPAYGPRARRPSKLDPYRTEIERLLDGEPELSGVRIHEELEKLGYKGGKSILNELLRKLRPRNLPLPRTFQRTNYRPGEICQFDLCLPKKLIPVGYGQLRQGYLVTCELPYSRAFAAALVFSKQFADIAWGMNRCLSRLGSLPEKLVWDREGSIAPKGHPTEAFAAYCGSLTVGWIILDAGDAQAKGALERTHRFVHGNFEAGRRFASPRDFQTQLDKWCEKVNRRKHRSTHRPVDERLSYERKTMRPLPRTLPQADERFVIRVPVQPYMRFDRNDYSLNPQLVGQRVEVVVGQEEITAYALDTGELACRHARVFAGGLTFTDPDHQATLDRLRTTRKSLRSLETVETRPLALYDKLIPA